MRENQLQEKVVRYLKQIPNLWFYVVNDRTTSGIPDIVGCYRGEFFGIELKVKGYKPTALQQYTRAEIKKAGGKCIVAYNMVTVKEFIKP